MSSMLQWCSVVYRHSFAGGVALWAILLAGVGPQLWAQEPPELRGLPSYIEQGLKDWNVPGLAIAVVKDDKVVYARGFGVRRLGSPDPVDEHTIFDIASTSKQITSAAIGMLVDEGVVHYDDPIIKHIPHFQLSDPWVTKRVTIRDLLAHRTALGRTVGGRLHYMTNHDREEVLYRARYIPFHYRFGSYSYNNVMYMTAGHVIQYAKGISWDEFIETRIFAPLGMTRSYTNREGPLSDPNIATGHAWVKGEVQKVRYRSFDNIGPAGSLTSSVQQMAQWLRLQLGLGMYEGKRLLSDSVVIEQHSAQIILPASEPFGPLRAYGFGLNLSDYHGRRLSRHGGGADGFRAQVLLVPQEGLGVVILTNLWANNLGIAVANRVADAYLGLPERDWSSELLQQWETRRARAEAQLREVVKSQVHGTSPSLPLERYTGVYEDDLYEEVVVRLRDGKLYIHFWEVDYLVAELDHWHYDFFKATWKDEFQTDKLVWFDLGKAGEVETLNVEWALRPPPNDEKCTSVEWCWRRIGQFKRVGDVADWRR